MKQCALVLAVIGAFGYLPQASAHQLAFSKKDNIKVEVPGDAASWCRPEVELTISRPAWDNQELLTGLLAKLPFVLGKDCSAAKVTWKAVDSAGNLYASGAGNAANLGIVTLAAPAKPALIAQPAQPAQPAQSAQAPATPVAVSPAAPEPAATVPATAAVAPAEHAPVVAAEPVQAPEPAAPAPAAAAPAVPAPAPVPTAVAAAPTSDFGRSLVLGNEHLAQIKDGAGCTWLISKSVIAEGESSLAFGSTPAMPCPAHGFSEGEYDKLSWKIHNTYRGDSWNKVYVHPSGLMFTHALKEAVRGKSLSFLSPQADQALFMLGEIPSRQMKVYLAYQRGNYRVLAPFNSDPYYVVTTPDESFALDPVQYKQAGLEVFQLIKSTSPSTVGLANFFVAKNLDTLYPAQGYGDDRQKIIRNRMGENRGQLIFDVRDGSNWAVQREKQRVQEERRQQERMASLHGRVLERYEQLKAGMKDYQGHESEALAELAGIRARYGSPLSMMDPASSKRASAMMVHVTGKDGQYYEIDFPGRGRLQSDQALANAWYVLQVANMTPVSPLVDAKAIPTFKVYSFGEPEACKEASCADRVSFGAVLGREFPEAGIDFSWTPEVSQSFVNTWNNASAQIQ